MLTPQMLGKCNGYVCERRALYYCKEEAELEKVRSPSQGGLTSSVKFCWPHPVKLQFLKGESTAHPPSRLLA